MSKSAPKRSRHSLRFLCWNINHSRDKIEGPKVDIPEIQDFFKSHDIFALQETKGEVNFSNYCCFNSNRKGSNSGGVCIGVHKSLQTGVTHVQMNASEDIVVVKLKATYFDLDRNTYLVNVYDSPTNGSFKKRRRDIETEDSNSTLEHLQEFLADIPLSEDVILLGDFNARTGTMDDMMSDNRHLKDYELNAHYCKQLTKRNNSDLKLNTNGRPFIELLQTTGLVILNGRTLGDIFGAPTCIQRHGVSTVDYICVSRSLHDKIRQFKIESISQYSDHRPLSMTISTNHLKRISTNIDTKDIQDAPKSFKWNRSENLSADSATQFRSAQNDQAFKDEIEYLLHQPANTADEAARLNRDLVATYHNLANSVTTTKRGTRTNKKKWFDLSCRRAKREASRADRNANRNPHSHFLRNQHFLKKKEYRSTKSRKKGKYLFEMNQKINESGNVNWVALKQLSEQHKDEEPFDIYDLLLFHKFFNDLYNRKCSKNHHSDDDVVSTPTTDELQNTKNLVDSLNREFTLQETKDAIMKLKDNKSVSDDLISNEMLKNSNEQLQLVIVKLFNACLQCGTYPLNNSITTPLHKKGDRQNPDNYRAITIGSCLGKLFSNLLLKRLIEFREIACPDQPYQLGFRSGAQCNDHLLTLNTIIEKYVKKEKKRLFACFVDYRKAFDSVCRDALLFKLGKMGLSGNFFTCISHMYNNSTTRVKLIQKLSAAIDVTIGTEQGHPMSPELFKVYIHELSIRLEQIEELNVPILNGIKVSHLLWADDLVLLALDALSLQSLLNCLHDYAEEWELSVNISKTSVMVFNTSARTLKCSYGFKLGSLDIVPVKRYCYLGIQFSLNGSFKQAIDELRKKALRSFFSMRRIINTKALTTSTMLKLIDSLVKPIATYGCPVWLSSTNIVKAILSKKEEVSLPKSAAKDPLETTHLKILKWILGVHKKANNNFCYGDTGRTPWTVTVIPQCLAYFHRASLAVEGNVNTLLHHTFQEQKLLNLNWYDSWSTIAKMSTVSKPQLSPTLNACGYIHETFVDHWKRDLLNQPKMSFYTAVKFEFGEEPYLQLPCRLNRVNIAKLRSSSHDLRIEKGRYTKDHLNTALKTCRFCCSSETDVICFLEELPFFETPILETEDHVLTECPYYHQLRSNLSDNLKSLLMLKEYGAIMNSTHIKEFGKYLTDSSNLRNPPKTSLNPRQQM